MEFSDLGEKKQEVTHGDAADYVNTRISTGSVNPAMDLNATKSQTTEHNYEQLRLESKRSDDKNVDKKNDRDTMRWKDQPKEIKCIIYTLSVMLVILYIIVTTIVVVMILPKDEPEGTWTQWSAWSNCDVTCDNGIQTRLRLCNNPSISTEQLDCKGNSIDSRQCQKNPCSDYGVAFTVYNPNTTGDSYTALKFRSSYLNKGDAYNSTTGVFTCRIPGVYHFAVTLTKQYKDISIVRAHVKIKDSTIIYLYYYPRSDDSNEVGTYIMTGTGTYHLNINDTVFVYGRPTYFLSSIYSSFTGFLVSPDV